MSRTRIACLIALPLLAAAGGSERATATPVSSQFVLDGAVVTSGTYNLATLSALPPTTQTVTYKAAGSPVTDTYSGTELQTLVNVSGGFTPAPGVKNPTLRNYVVAVGSDGYQAVFAGGEIDPKFGNRPYMAAYSDTMGHLGPGGSDGFARMVVPGDVAGGRYVSNLVNLHAGTAPSLPGTGGGVSRHDHARETGWSAGAELTAGVGIGRHVRPIAEPRVDLATREHGLIAVTADGNNIVAQRRVLHTGRRRKAAGGVHEGPKLCPGVGVGHRHPGSGIGYCLRGGR
jgi:hypothetical protein